MKFAKWTALFIACALLFGYGWVYGAIVFDMYRALRRPGPPNKHDIPRGECELKLPDIDMRDARELLPLEDIMDDEYIEHVSNFARMREAIKKHPYATNEQLAKIVGNFDIGTRWERPCEFTDITSFKSYEKRRLAKKQAKLKNFPIEAYEWL